MCKEENIGRFLVSQDSIKNPIVLSRLVYIFISSDLISVVEIFRNSPQTLFCPF